MREELEAIGEDSYPELNEFVKTGMHERPKDLARECRRLYRKLHLGPVKHTIGRLARAAEKAKRLIAMTD